MMNKKGHNIHEYISFNHIGHITSVKFPLSSGICPNRWMSNIRRSEEPSNFIGGQTCGTQANPTPPMVLITGRNGKGKTELLNYIDIEIKSAESVFFLESSYELLEQKSEKFIERISEILEEHVNIIKFLIASSKFVPLEELNPQMHELVYGSDSHADGQYYHYKNTLQSAGAKHTFFNKKVEINVRKTFGDSNFNEKFLRSLSDGELNQVIHSSILEAIEEIKPIEGSIYILLVLNYYKMRADKIKKLLQELGKDESEIAEAIMSQIGEDPRKIINQAIGNKISGHKIAELNEKYNNTNIFKCQMISILGKEIPFPNLSSGESLIFQLLAIWQFSFFNHNNLKTSKVKIMLLDEPDKHLDPNLCKLFMKTIREEFIEKGIQVIMTTHDTNTIAFAADDEIFTCKKK